MEVQKFLRRARPRVATRQNLDHRGRKKKARHQAGLSCADRNITQ
jgi:hypothetical protein